jgi:hypothetical protein
MPYRECKNCNDISFCHNLDTETLTGKITIPSDCPKRDLRQKEIDLKDLKKESYV